MKSNDGKLLIQDYWKLETVREYRYHTGYSAVNFERNKY